MPYTFEDLVAHERRRWMRPDAHLLARPDAGGSADCVAARWRERLLHRDHKLWNFHVQTAVQRRPPAEQTMAIGGQGFAAQLARLQAQHDSIRRAFVELQQQRRCKRILEQAPEMSLRRSLGQVHRRLHAPQGHLPQGGF